MAAAISAFAVAACAAQSTRPQYDTQYGYDNGYDQPGPDVEMFAGLDYYGGWIHLNTYGWVWQPHMRAGWRPYTSGHWVWSEYGWTWVSYEPFGWAVYHYGNWIYDTRLGWLWIPGYDWAPNRVEWVVTDGYVCWAPLPPPGVRIGYPWDPGRVNFWIIVSGSRFTDPDVGRYRVATTRFKSRYAHRDDNGVVYEAPKLRTIERYKGHNIPQVDVRIEREQRGGHEIRRMQMPDHQTRIIQRHQVKVPRVQPQRRPQRPHIEHRRYKPQPRGDQRRDRDNDRQKRRKPNERSRKENRDHRGGSNRHGGHGRG